MTTKFQIKSTIFKNKYTICKYTFEDKYGYITNMNLTFETKFYTKYNPIVYMDTLNLFKHMYVLKLNNGSYCYYFEKCNDKSKRFDYFYSIYNIIFNNRFSKKEESKILEECSSRYYIFTRKTKSLNIIKNGLHNYLWAPKCKDGSVGLIPRIAWKNMQKYYSIIEI
jgi:hypothetical protein